MIALGSNRIECNKRGIFGVPGGVLQAHQRGAVVHWDDDNQSQQLAYYVIKKNNNQYHDHRF
jgi:hypothetical protein